MNEGIGGELQERLWVSGGKYHLLVRVTAEVHIFMREGGPTLITNANVYLQLFYYFELSLLCSVCCKV